VYYGSKIYESTTDEAEISFEEERFRQRIQEKASQPFSAVLQAPVACNNEKTMTNLVNMVDRQRWLNNVHQTLSRPGIKMNSSPCKFQERTQNSYPDDLTIDKELVIVDIMSMFNPQHHGEMSASDSIGVQAVRRICIMTGQPPCTQGTL